MPTKGEPKHELTAHLRTQRTRRKPRTGGAKRATLGITEDLTIRGGRPAEVADRAVPGHWEGALLLEGTGKGAVTWWSGPAGSCSPRYRAGTPAALARMSPTEVIATLPIRLRRSITWDRDSEMAEHARFKIETGIPIYFCDPEAPWQRGTNENRHGLLRQYWRKGADLRSLTRTECDHVALRLNTRLPMTLEWQTPARVLNQRLVASAV